ncbi:DUF932 domain-containing protein [Solimonas flava]|uniref:DUF932 domain-containing protein n=1 Tax=Solimonas flava TaxID=415849 RepID=UPI00041206C7|nr:DUF932 domain-containing protein [Solimonas flava]
MHLVQSMAYVNETPWHGLGTRLEPHQPIEVWAREAGMDWQVLSADVRFATDASDPEQTVPFSDQKVLYRSDSYLPLSVVSKRFQIVQPAEILEFYRDLTEIGGFQLETAGVLKEGRKLWALARTGHSAYLKGGDQVDGYLLLATACDGSMATTAQFTSVRVVCNNTLAIALGDNAGAVKVGHRSQFNAQAVKRQLGIAISSWGAFMARIKAMAACAVSDATAKEFLTGVLASKAANSSEAVALSERTIQSVHELYAGKGLGSQFSSSAGTAWGLLNSVTEYVDHHRRSHSPDHRRDAAWFGQGSAIKQRAWEASLKLVA